MCRISVFARLNLNIDIGAKEEAKVLANSLGKLPNLPGSEEYLYSVIHLHDRNLPQYHH